MVEQDILLEVQNVSKSFSTTHALKNVNLNIKKGTIHSLVGRNGAGKSTMVNIIAGVYRQDKGSVIFEGKDISHLTLKERQDMGIRLVTQHASIVPDMDVAENISLGLWPKNKAKFIDWKGMHKRAVEVMDEFGLKVDPYKKLRELSPVDQRKVNIIRALFGGGKLIILDEPTTSLSVEDRENLFHFVKKQAKSGITFIFISHYLEEVLRVSDEITVVRDGEAYTGSKCNSQQDLANLVAGEEVELTMRDPEKVIDENVVLECENLCARFLEPTSLKIRKGEIVGFVGFPGSGAREICTTIYGLTKKHGGTIKMHGKQIEIREANDALKNKICYLPDDRHAYGIVPIMSIRENIGLSSLKYKLKSKFGMLNLKKEESIAEHSLQALKIKARTIDDTAASLSGGNQQKVVLAKVLACDPEVLILDEPTIGIDIKSREEIMKLIQDLTTMGLSVIYVTNDFDELLRIADRVVIFNKGRIVGDVVNDGITPEKVIEIRDNKGGIAV